MSIRNKSKDHLKEQGGVELVEASLAPYSDDLLRFWTHHPTENVLVDLRLFAKGEVENPRSNGAGVWGGPFSGRPELIMELAPAVQARLTLAAEGTCTGYKNSLRAFWRVFDQMEVATADGGRTVERLKSLGQLNHLHEAAAHRAGIVGGLFTKFIALADDARRLMQLPSLYWTPPSHGEPNRQLIPADQAKALKIKIKQDWENVRKTWRRHDAIRRGEDPDTLSEWEKRDAAFVRHYAYHNEKLRRNWQHLKRIQTTTGRMLPTPEQLRQGVASLNAYTGLETMLMRALIFPTVGEVDIAFHATLMGSGWNPSTLVTGIDATLPERIFLHPKDANQNVLMVDAPESTEDDKDYVTMQGSKRRAGGRMQFCLGQKKDPASPPAIVAVWLERTTALREQLRHDCSAASSELARLKTAGAAQETIERQFIVLQTLQQGLRNVWLYVDNQGKINWINCKRWARYETLKGERKRSGYSYLDSVIGRLNTERETRDEPAIGRVTPSDFRDIYARWVYIKTGGNIIAVMLALGHAGLRSTNKYLDNNIFNAENDETVRRFMTHLFQELEQGRVDLTILAHLVRHGSPTPEMQARLNEYRLLMRSRVKVGCADAKHPPAHIAPDHAEGKLCGTQRCLRDCHNARFLPESVDGIAMRVEELFVMSDYLPLETWLRGEFEKELEAGEFLLADLYPEDAVSRARAHWREKILSGKHVVPGVGLIRDQEAA
jgi:hypothetical protein